MRIRLLLFRACLVICAVSATVLLVPESRAATPESVALQLSSAQWKQVDAGEVLVSMQRKEGSNTGDVTVIGMIDQPLPRVWATMTNPDIMKTIYPGILRAEVRARTGRYEDHYVLLDYPWPLEDRWSVNRTKVHAAVKGYSWFRVEGTVKENKGYWRLFERNNRTVLYYQVRFNPGLAVVPDWVLRFGMKKEAPGVVRHLRRYFATQR